MGPDEIEGWVDRLAGPLALYARRWTDSPEDAVQEAFVELARRAHQPPDDPAAWLFRAVRNRSINAGIAARRRSRREAEAAAARNGHAFEPTFGDGIDPDAVASALDALPDAQREAIVGHLWGALSFEQIARLNGTSSSTSHRLYRAGLATLRARLGPP